MQPEQKLEHPNQEPPTHAFTTTTFDDLPTIKLHKYRHYLSTQPQQAQELFPEMSTYALSQSLIGEYELLYETIKQDIEKTEIYKTQRQEMITYTNPIRQQIEHAESISAYEETAHLYFKLALYYKSIGMHKESSTCFNKLFRLQSITTSKIIYQKSQYFSLWAQELYFDNNFGIFVRNEVEDEKKVDVNLMIVKDLKYIEMGRAETKFFENLLAIQTPGDITKNDIISLEDLGLLYSLVLLAKKDREAIKRKVPWSSNIEVLYLQNNFNKLLSTLEHEYQHRGRFHPLIDKLYNECMKSIKERILIQYISAFTSVSLKDIENNTTYREGELLQYLNLHPELPYLIDPITQSLVYKEKSIPLYEETMEYGYRVREKWREMVRSCINSRKSEEAEMQTLQGEGSLNQRGMRGMMFGERRYGYDGGYNNRDD